MDRPEDIYGRTSIDEPLEQKKQFGGPTFQGMRLKKVNNQKAKL